MKKMFFKVYFVLMIILINQDSVFSQVTVDFSTMSNAPLLKKFSMYSTTINGNGSITDFTRQLSSFKNLQTLDAPTYRIDLAMGKGDTWGYDVVGGTYNSRTYDFTRLDRWTDSCFSNNIIPYISWCYVPVPFNSGGNHRDLNQDLANWQTYWQEMHKDFAAHIKSANNRKPVYNEIYNEPDYTDFLTADDYTNRYSDMYKYASLGIRQGDPDAIVGGPAFAGGNNAPGFLQMVAANNLPLDFFSFHNYRNSDPWPGEVNICENQLQSQGFTKTVLHISEYNFEQGSNWSNKSWLGNTYPGGWYALSYIKEIMDSYHDVEKVHWAMFLNAGVTGMGVIDFYGKKKAIYNGFKIFADMPVERYSFSSIDPQIAGMASCSADKCAIVAWNIITTADKNNVTIRFNNTPFATGDVKVYRIDKLHASSYDSAPENLEVVESSNNVTASGYQWTGTIPSQGVVYITLNRTGSTVRDFHPEDSYVDLAKFIKPYFYYYARRKTFWNNFDEKRWIAYVGSGSEVGTMVAPVGVEAENLPSIINFKGELNGTPQQIDVNTLVGVQIDFRSSGSYTKSVLFHGGVYNTGRTWAMPWGKGGLPTTVEQVNLADFNVKIADYAPTGWDGRVLITTIIQDCGANVRFKVNMNSGSNCTGQTVTFNSIKDKLVTDSVFSVSATASSGLPVHLRIISGPATINGNNIHLTGATGTVTVAADQSGDTTYCPALQVQNSFNVKKLNGGDGLNVSYWTAQGVFGQWPQKVPPVWFIDSICGAIEPTIDDSWPDDSITGKPSCLPNQDFWNARWTGYIQPLYSETYTFCSTFDDGVKLWINDSVIINHFPGGGGVVSYCGTINLKAGVQYPIRLDFAQYWSAAQVNLQWNSKSQTQEVVPQSQLYSTKTITGINQQKVIAVDWSIFPNPATDQITINSGNSEINKIKIFNLQGQQLIEINEPFKGLKTIDLSEFSKGNYFIQLMNDNIITTKEIICQ